MALQDTRFAFDFWADVRSIVLTGEGITVADVLEDVGIPTEFERLSRELAARTGGQYQVVHDPSGVGVDIVAGGTTYHQRDLRRAMAKAVACLVRQEDPNAGAYERIAYDLAESEAMEGNLVALVQDLQCEWPDLSPEDDLDSVPY